MSGFNLSAWAIRHQTLVLFFILVTALAGVYAYSNLGRNEDPAFTVKVMVVTAVWPGASAAEMQEQVADRVETRLQTLPWLSRLETYTRPGFMATQIVLDDATPPSEVAELWYQARKKVGDISGEMPQGVRGPFFNDEYADVYVQVHALTAPGATWSELSDLAEMARQSFLAVPGVEKVQLFGEQDQKIHVDISYAKLATLGIPASAIFDALAAQNAVVPSGSVDTPSETVQVRVSGSLTGVEAVAAVPVEAEGRVFRLGDIATVSRGVADPQSYAARYNGEDTILLGVAMSEGGNVLELGERLHEKAAEIKARLPVGAELHQVSNQPEVVEEAVGEFLLKFVVAISIVLLVSFLSLGFRTGIIVALSVPLTLGATFVVMLLMGIDLERISLGALILSLGLLVDDAIIAIEMMVVKIEQGWDRFRAATFAWESTAFPMLTGTLVTAAGFLPVGFAKSAAGEYAGGIFWVVTSALLISWLVAVIFTPYLGLKLLPRSLERHAAERGEIDEEAIYHTPSYNRLRKMVAAAVRFRLPVVLATVGLLVLAGYGMGFVKQQFFPSSSRPEVLVELKGPEGASFAATEREAKAVEDWLKTNEHVDYFTTYVGAGAPRFFLAYNPALPNPSYALILVQTKGGEHADALVDELQARFAEAEGAVRGRANKLELGPPVGYPVQFRVVGQDLEEVRAAAAKVRDAMRASPDTRNTELQWGEKVKSVRLEVDQDRARALGLSTTEIGQSLQTLLSGYEVTSLREGRHSVGVVVRADETERAALGDLGDMVLQGVWTGQRQADRLSLTHAQLRDLTLAFRQAKKGGQPLEIPVARLLEKRLAATARRRQLREEALREGGKPVVVWPHVNLDEKGGRPFRSKHYQHVYREVANAAAWGLWRVPAEDGGPLVLATVVPAGRPAPRHIGTLALARLPASGAVEVLPPMPSLLDLRDQDLRDTAVTWLARAGADKMEIASITGHSLKTIDQILQHYFGLHPDLAKRAIGKLEDWYMGAEG